MPPLALGARQAGQDALTEASALEPHQRPEDVELERASRRGRINTDIN